MTVVAWDGTTLAADRMTNFGGLHATTTKVHRVGEYLVSGCGRTALLEEMRRWFADGADPAKFPTQQRDEKESVSLLVVPRSGPILQYETTPFPLVIENKQWAVGSGRDFAIAAMYLGKTAREAVEVASVLCNDCGNGVDELTHNVEVTGLRGFLRRSGGLPGWGAFH